MFDVLTVTVFRPTVAGTDDLMNPIPGEPVKVDVPGCLVAPGATSDLDATRPDGVNVAMTVHFPKAYADSLRGCSVTVPGYEGTYEVIGDPQPYMPKNTPGLWNRPAEVRRVEG